MIAIYLVFIKKSPEQANLNVVGNESNAGTLGATNTTGVADPLDNQLSKDFLTVLLSIKNINLDDSIFSNVAFMNLKDSTILLVPDGNEGRPNPFAPIGTDNNIVPASVSSGFGTEATAQNDSLFGVEGGLLTEIAPAPVVKPTTTKKP